MLTVIEVYELTRDVIRAKRVCLELADILQRDATLFKRIKPRTLRWIRKLQKQQQLDEDKNDATLLTIKKRKAALSKLTLDEQALLGLYNPNEANPDDNI